MAHTDSTQTVPAIERSRSRRVDDQQRQAQQRLADKSFTRFMREHNRKVEGR